MCSSTHKCIFIAVLVSSLAFTSGRMERKDLTTLNKIAARDMISFPAEISSPFLDQEEVTSASKLQERFKHAVGGLFEIVMRLKKVISEVEGDMNGGNFVVSPLSVAAALGQLLLGARGETRRRLAQLLTPLSEGRLDEDFHRELGGLIRYLQEDLPESANYTLDVAGAFFVLRDLQMTESFRFAVANLYGGEFVRLNFSSDSQGAQDYVNGWVSKHTRGHITSILPYPLPLSTAALLANTIYFSGAWKTQFDPEDSIQSNFRVNSTHEVPITLMRNSFDILYANSSEFHIVALPYKNEEAALFIILTHNESKAINDVMADLSLVELHRVIKTMSVRTVNFAMPKMTISATFSLREPLARLQQIAKQSEKHHHGIQLNILDESDLLNKNVSNVETNQTTKEETINKRPDNSTETVNSGMVNSGMVNSSKLANSTVVVASKEEVNSNQTEVSKIVPGTENDKKNPNTGKAENKVQNSQKIPDKHAIENNASSKSNSESKDQITTTTIPTVMRTEVTANVTEKVSQDTEDRNKTETTVPLNAGRSSRFRRQTQRTVPRNEQTHGNFMNVQKNSPNAVHTPFSTTGKDVTQELRGRSGTRHNSESTSKSPGQSQIIPQVPVMNDVSLDMTGASEDSRFRIDDIIHQAWIEISEKGTEATAVSASSVDYSLDIVNFKVTRPFLFFIRHELTLAPLFWGAIADPTANTDQQMPNKLK